MSNGAERKKDLSGIIAGSFGGRRAKPSAASALKAVPKPDDDEEKLERLSKEGGLAGYGVSRSAPTSDIVREAAQPKPEDVEEAVPQTTEASHATAQTQPTPSFSLAISLANEPKSRIRVHVSQRMIDEVNSLRTHLPALNLTAISGTMWSMYKTDMGVAFDNNGALVGFDVLKQQKLLAGIRDGQGSDVLIFPLTETNKREITTLKKSVGGLVYRAILERSWELYKAEMEFVFNDGQLQL